MNPVLPLPILIPLLLVVIGLGVWLSWRSTDAADRSLRKKLIVLRILALLALAVFLMNPGKWQAMQDQTQKVWLCLLDDSESMSVKLSSDVEVTRSQEAQRLTRDILKKAEDEGLKTRRFSFGGSLTELQESESGELSADGSQSDLSTAADALLTQMSAQGEAIAGVIVLSDGRQTHVPRNSDFALRAQALGIPFYAVPVGGKHANRDLALMVPRKTVTAFPDQNVQISVALKSEGLPSLEAEVFLEDEKGEQLSSQNIRVNKGEHVLHTFSIKAPVQSTSWKLRVAKQADEMRVSNNESEVHIRILRDKARVFLAEGAPYWDSKFLAQLLRQQKHMEVHSVHRLSDSRWFRIDSGEAKPHESGVDVFPDTQEKLMGYDLIIFGKNSEHFLDDKRSANLRAFVKDQGGAVLFARSKPYTGKLPGVEPLEPVSWATGITGEFQLRPSVDGQAAGLFGQALPAPDSPIWSSLPKLKDAHRVDVVKPFTRVLAHGELASNAVQGRFPLLMVRRYGQGVTGLVNADGLWKWDFFPDARELGNMYHEYWIQMIHWMLAYSEFLPGHDYSLNLSSGSVQPGTPIALRMAYRGQGKPDPPVVQISSPALREPLTLAPSEMPSADGRLKWSANFTPEKPGTYHIRMLAAESDKNKTTMPESTLNVQPPPAEMDELSADADFLTQFAESTGGSLVSISGLPSFIDDNIKKQAPQARDQGVEWVPFWLRWFMPFLLLAFLATEWWLRRRNGLV